MAASWLQAVVAALSSQVAEVESHPLVVLDLVASACRAVEWAFFQVEEVRVEERQVAAAVCHLQLAVVLQNSHKMHASK